MGSLRPPAAAVILALLCLAGASPLPSDGASQPALVSGGPVLDVDDPGHASLASRLRDHVKNLADPSMEGRGIGTAGIERAAGYVEDQFQRMGLAGTGTSGYSQTFEVTVGAKLGEGNALRLGGQTMSPGWDYTPVGFSSSGSFGGDAVFAGYGITDPSRGYDDYAGVDATGRVVVVLRYEPQEMDPKSVFDGTASTVHATLRAKATNAKLHGAAALILVTGPLHHATEADELVTLVRGAAEAAAGIPCVHASLAAFSRAAGITPKSLADWQTARDADLAKKPAPPFASIPVAGRVEVQHERAQIRNVVGIVRGSTDEAVVVGAHYDHLGRGGAGSLEPGSDAIHHGADDNASGTAAMIELARTVSSGEKPRRTHVFVAFTGEESGLLGSAHYVRSAPISISKTALMINFDMVGRMRENVLHVMGTETGSGLKAIVEKQIASAGLTGRWTPGGYGPSDHSSFYAVKIPVLFFFTGAHPDYHRPTDTWDKVDPDGMATIVTAAAAILAEQDKSAAPAYQSVAGDAPSARGEGGGYGPYFGVIPEFGGQENTGVRISGARSGSPAERAGLVAGDRLVSFGGHAIANLHDLTYALRRFRPGDRVAVQWDRAGTKMSAEAVLEKRKSTGDSGAHGSPHAPPPHPTTTSAPAGRGDPSTHSALRAESRPGQADPLPLVLPGERFFAKVRQITFGGENAEAYWSPDGKHLVMQCTRAGHPCDQIYVIGADGTGEKRISTGTGRCTCAFFLSKDRVLFSSTHASGTDCPPAPDRSKGYAWALYPEYAIYTSRLDGTDLRPLHDSKGYDAEATVSSDGEDIVFTSTRDGDPELYLMHADGTGVERLTNEEGYDGGAVFSPDGKKLVFRASRPTTVDDRATFRGLMAQNLVRPSRLEIYVMDLATRQVTQVTRNGAANFAPCWTPDSRRILFVSNVSDPKGRNFDIYLVNEDGSGLTRVTEYDGFDGFPLFSPDGKRLAFASNRNGKAPGETNIFIADWRE